MRGAYYALISALSGTQTMALCSYDEAYTIPTEYSARISLRTMQLLVEEMGLAETVDPLAGSFYVETMTNEMRKKMEEIMAETDAQGGIVKMVSEGTIQAKVSSQAYLMQRKIESGEFPKVGVNCYRNEQEEDHPVEFHPYNEADAQVQIDNLKRTRAERDNTRVDAALSRLRQDAAAGRNVMPALVEAVKAYASVGEMTKELVNVFGRYQEPIRF